MGKRQSEVLRLQQDAALAIAAATAAAAAAADTAQEVGLAKWDLASSRSLAWAARQQRRMQRRWPFLEPAAAKLQQRLAIPAWIVVLLAAAVCRICVDFKPDPCAACAIRGYECLVI